LQFPSVAQLISSDLLGGTNNSNQIHSTKINQIITIYDQVLSIQNQLFKLPVDMETLLPQYCQQIPQKRMLEVYDRIQELKKRTEEMLEFNQNITDILKKEKMVIQFSNLLRDGQEKISNMREWISTNFPTQDPNSKQPRILMAFLLEWYISLISNWESILEDTI